MGPTCSLTHAISFPTHHTYHFLRTYVTISNCVTGICTNTNPSLWCSTFWRESLSKVRLASSLCLNIMAPALWVRAGSVVHVLYMDTSCYCVGSNVSCVCHRLAAITRSLSGLCGWCVARATLLFSSAQRGNSSPTGKRCIPLLLHTGLKLLPYILWGLMLSSTSVLWCNYTLKQLPL